MDRQDGSLVEVFFVECGLNFYSALHLLWLASCHITILNICHLVSHFEPFGGWLNCKKHRIISIKMAIRNVVIWNNLCCDGNNKKLKKKRKTMKFKESCLLLLYLLLVMFCITHYCLHRCQCHRNQFAITMGVIYLDQDL